MTDSSFRNNAGEKKAIIKNLYVLIVLITVISDYNMNEITTIPITKKVRDMLKSYGLKGETYDIILRRMMKQVDHEEFMERQYKLLQEKDKFVSLDEI